MSETPSAPTPTLDTTKTLAGDASTVVPDGAALPAGAPAELGVAAGGTLGAMEDELRKHAAERNSFYERRRQREEKLFDLACDLLEKALDGTLANSDHSKQRLDAAISIVRRS